jgi:RNA-binding protein
MKYLTGLEKKHLIKLAHKLKPLIYVGKSGVTNSQITTIDKALMDHELIKVKFLGHKSEKKELSRAIADKTKSELLLVVGNTILLYKESSNAAKRQRLLKKKNLPPPRKRIQRSPRG